MDKRPPIDLEKLKEIQDLKKKRAQAEEKPVEAPKPNLKPHPSLTDPYWYRRHLISIEDFDEWA